VSTSPEHDPLFGNSLTALLGDAVEAGATSAAPPAAPVWSPPSPEDLGRLFPGYRIESLIGSGGMGAVYKARQLRLNRDVAIKALPAELAEDAEFVQRLEREAQTLAGLNHPGIVAIYDLGKTAAGHLYFVMELVNGTNLQQLIQNGGLLPAQALEITIQVCEALHYAHQHGVIHRDIKPANVLVTAEGRAKLADFGLARPLGAVPEGTLTSPSRVVGSPHYTAPEQWQGKADCRSDIYALGITLYEMLTCMRPTLNYVPPSKRVPVDARLDQVVDKALQPKPEERYQAVADMQQDVDHIRLSPRKRRKVVSSHRHRMAAAADWQNRLLWLLATTLLAILAFVLYLVIQNHLPGDPALKQSSGDAAAAADERAQLVQARADLQALIALMDRERTEFRDALAVINKHTANKTIPVREGSSAYFQCLAASKVIKGIEASAPQRLAEKNSLEKLIQKLGDQALLARVAELEAALQSLQEQLGKKNDLPDGALPASAPR